MGLSKRFRDSWIRTLLILKVRAGDQFLRMQTLLQIHKLLPKILEGLC